ncbi:helix-turn-helix transcriptional regulator [Motiliproteus sp. SC1-56]|uniref:helix-turn-helix transcriptional regulator n=1 Tax=Motiliproteus sp. SC1-56 TaxID=2799565 RepID=UPI001A8F16D9|nr:helix-turn-helix transcriptional regulator [Motiliproteus sp. SC1-56]
MEADLVQPHPRFMNIRQVAEYLHLNEKKVYTLASEGQIPATKVTGKWLFPRDLVDQWLLESSHGGVMSDRLIIAGSDDPLLHRAISQVAKTMQTRALVSYTSTGTRLGLSLLARQRADVCALHWGPCEESHFRHPALLSRHRQHRKWVLVHAFKRDQGIILSPGSRLRYDSVPKVLQGDLRWSLRQDGAGAMRFLEETLGHCGYRIEQLNQVEQGLTEREVASQVAMGLADAGPGARSTAREFGLEFVSMGWESFDLALYRGVFFRHLFRELMQQLDSGDCRNQAERLGGYDFSETGKVVWSS